MENKFTVEEQELLHTDLNKQLEEYYGCYQVKVLSSQIHFATVSSIADGYHMLYTARLEINNEADNIVNNLGEMLANKTHVFEIFCPPVSKDVKLKIDSVNVEQVL